MKIFLIINFSVAVLYWIILISVGICANRKFKREKNQNIQYVNPFSIPERIIFLVRVLIISIIPIINFLLFIIALFTFDKCVENNIEKIKDTFNTIEKETP